MTGEMKKAIWKEKNKAPNGQVSAIKLECGFCKEIITDGFT